MTSVGPLTLGFYGTEDPSAPAGANTMLEDALRDFDSRGRAAWPKVPLDPTAFAAYLGARVPEGAEPVAWLGELRAGDLFLACACAEGSAEALRAFDATFLERMSAYLKNLRPSPDLVATTRQDLLEKLFVGGPEGAPKITQYEGKGSLEGWVRVTAVRAALNRIEASKSAEERSEPLDDLALAVAPEGDPEIDLLRARYKDDFLAALRAAIAGLPRRDRALLRFVFVERLSPARIAVMYRVHRTTAMRWIDAAEEEIFARTRNELAARHNLSASECDHVLSVMKSRVDISLNALFRSGA